MIYLLSRLRMPGVTWPFSVFYGIIFQYNIWVTWLHCQFMYNSSLCHFCVCVVETFSTSAETGCVALHFLTLSLKTDQLQTWIKEFTEIRKWFSDTITSDAHLGFYPLTSGTSLGAGATAWQGWPTDKDTSPNTSEDVALWKIWSSQPKLSGWKKYGPSNFAVW